MSQATYYIFQKPLLKKYPPLTLTAWSYLFGALSKLLSTFHSPPPVEPDLAFLLFTRTFSLHFPYTSHALPMHFPCTSHALATL
jgi:drug/metabolite transporter (DMT)-like permease